MAVKKLRCLFFALLTAAALTGAASADMIAGPAIAGSQTLWLLLLLAAVGLIVAICAHIINK